MAGAADFVAPRPLAVTVGNYFNHLLMYADGRFARHPCFCYFALSTEMRWQALQAGRIYVCQHPHDAQLFFVLLFISAIIVLQSQALRRNVYRHVRSGSPPPNALHSSSNIMNVNKPGSDGRPRSSLLRAPGRLRGFLRGVLRWFGLPTASFRPSFTWGGSSGRAGPIH